MVGKTKHPECNSRTNYREILIEKGLPLSFTATSQEEEISEYSGNNAWNYNGTNGNMNNNNKNNALAVRPVTEFHEISVW